MDSVLSNTFKQPAVQIEIFPPGRTASNVQAGDFILVNRPGFVQNIIRLGEWLHFHHARWSHAAYCKDSTTIIEALTHGVKQNPLSVYHNREYAVIHTHLDSEDEKQATVFAESCLGQNYGWLIDLGIALRFLTPGKGLWFGMNGTEICSGLVAQTQVRGWANFPENPASMSPEGLWTFYTELLGKDI